MLAGALSFNNNDVLLNADCRMWVPSTIEAMPERALSFNNNGILLNVDDRDFLAVHARALSLNNDDHYY